MGDGKVAKKNRYYLVLLFFLLLSCLQGPVFAVQISSADNSTQIQAAEDPTLLGTPAGGVQELKVEGGYLLNFSYNITSALIVVPWEGSGDITLTATGVPVQGAVSTISFYAVQDTGEQGEEIGGTYLPWTGGNTNRAVVRSNPFHVEQGAAREIAMVVRGGGSDGETITYRLRFYRTQARMELKTGVTECADGSRQLRAELWAYNGSFNGVLFALRFDPEVLQVSNSSDNQAQAPVQISKAMESTEYLGVNGLLTVQNKEMRFNQSTGIFRIAFAPAGTKDLYITAGSEGLHLATFCFRVAEGAALNRASLYVDGEDAGYDSNCYTQLMPNGYQYLIREELFNGAITYPDGFQVVGLPGALEAALPELFNLTGASVTAVDEQTAEIAYPNGTVTVTWENYDKTWAVLPSTAELSVSAQPKAGYSALGWDKPVGGRLYTETLEDVYGQLKALTPLFQADHAGDTPDLLAGLEVVEPAGRPLLRADGGVGFDSGYLTYRLVLLPAETEAVIRVAVPQGATAEAAVDLGESTVLPAGESEWTAAQLQDGNRLRITIGNHSYLIYIERQAEPQAVFRFQPQAGRADLAEASFTMAQMHPESSTLTMELPDGTWLADEEGQPLEFDSNGVLSQQSLAKLTAGIGLAVTEVRVETLQAMGNGKLTIKLEASAEEVIFSGGKAVGFYIHIPYETWKGNLPSQCDVQVEDTWLGTLNPLVEVIDTPPHAVAADLGSYDPKKPLQARLRYWQEGSWQEIAVIPQMLSLWTGDNADYRGNGQGTDFYTQKLVIPGLWSGRWQVELHKQGHVGIELEFELRDGDLIWPESRLDLPCGDLNGDGAVTMEDYALLADSGVIGTAASGQENHSIYDLSGDGRIDWSDLSILSSPGNLGRRFRAVYPVINTDAT